MSGWIDRLKKWQELRPWEQGIVCLAIPLLPMVSLSLNWAGLKFTTRFLRGLCHPAHTSIATVPADYPEAVARLVSAAARYHPLKPACLAQSVTLWFLLARKGVESAVKIGVAKDGGVFGAHAWVEIDGRVFLDAPDVAQRFGVIV